MKQLPIPVTILISIAIMLGFALILSFGGIPIYYIPGIEQAAPYTAQMISEIMLSFYGLGMMCLLGQVELLRTKGEGWLKSTYIAGLFVGYIVYDFIGQLYVQSMQTERNIQPLASVLIFAITMFLVGFAEETVFRGAILNLLLDRFPKTKGGVIAAIIVNGVCFGALHLINIFSGADVGSVLIQVVTAGFMGAAFAAVYVRTRNLWICIFAHALVDFATLFWGTLFQGTDLISGINNITWLSLLAIPMFLIPIIILLRKTKLQEVVDIACGQSVDNSQTDAKPVAIVSLIMGGVAISMSCAGYFMGLGIIGLLGAILSMRYKKEGNKLAIAALIVSIVAIVISLIGVIFMIAVEIPMTNGLDVDEMIEQLKNMQ